VRIAIKSVKTSAYDDWPKIRRTRKRAIFVVLRAPSSAPDELAGPVRGILKDMWPSDSMEVMSVSKQRCRKNTMDTTLTLINMPIHSISLLEK
jgi:hypothetical protein